jgi:hypothetical protein
MSAESAQSAELSHSQSAGMEKETAPYRVYVYPHEIFVGREEAWARRSLPLECGHRHGIYFGRLLQAGQ